MAVKTWFVTGATSGFGRLWAEAALRRGDRVVATGRNADALAELAASYGENLLPIQLDVTDRAAVFDAVQRAHAHFGRLDVVLCAAGYSYQGAVEELDFDEAKANFDTNLFGVLSVVQAVLPILREQGSGHILTVSSFGGLISLPTGGAYVAGKFALEGLSEGLAGEVAGFGVHVTIIEPGVYATGFGTAARTPKPMDEYTELRTRVRAGFRAEMVGDPAATAPAILKVVDAQQPPLRLILGEWVLDQLKDVYGERIATWESWQGVAAAAQR